MIMEKKEQNSKTIQPLNEAELDEVNGGVDFDLCYCSTCMKYFSNRRDYMQHFDKHRKEWEP